jgi:demethylmenaquinone methyltransferase / 2-methoxy-6-polyprenyl-1,4-benzoquinol methylase
MLARVLRPGATVVVLEFTRPRRAPFSTFYELWFNRLVPLLGRLSRDATAYSYLPASVRVLALVRHRLGDGDGLEPGWLN